jgi:flagellar hook-associated protein 2
MSSVGSSTSSLTQGYVFGSSGGGSSSSSSSGLLQLSGLASGLDTNSIIQQLMAVEAQPQRQLQQKQMLEIARQTALQTITTQLGTLQSAVDAVKDPTLWADTQTVDSSDANLVATRVSGAAAGAYTINVTKLAAADQYTQSSSNTTAAADDTLHIAVGSGSTFDVAVANGDTLAAIASKINGTSGIPVYATVVNNKLVLSGKTTGAANTISITGGGNAGFTFAQSGKAADAQLTVDSGLGPVSVTSSSNTVTNAIAGITLTLKGLETNQTITVGAPAPDTSAIQSKVQAFVDAYNTTVTFIMKKLTEKKVSNPQNEADREQGMLNGDSTLGALLSSMRQAVADVVQGQPAGIQVAAQAGLSTGAASGTIDQDSVQGKLTLDGDTFSSALASSLDNVKALFTKIGSGYSSNGVAKRLDDILDSYTDATSGVMTARVNSEQTLIDGYASQITAWTDRLNAKEASLRMTFTNMEVALAQNQQTLAALDSQIAKL